MHDEKESRLSEWYGTQPDAVPGGHGHRPEEPSSLSSQIPPRRSSGPSPSYYEPYWSEDNQGPGHSRKKHTGARVFGVCMLAIIVIAASALLFSNGGGMFSPAVRATPMRAQKLRIDSGVYPRRRRPQIVGIRGSSQPRTRPSFTSWMSLRLESSVWVRLSLANSIC